MGHSLISERREESQLFRGTSKLDRLMIRPAKEPSAYSFLMLPARVRSVPKSLSDANALGISRPLVVNYTPNTIFIRS